MIRGLVGYWYLGFLDFLRVLVVFSFVGLRLVLLVMVYFFVLGERYGSFKCYKCVVWMGEGGIV